MNNSKMIQMPNADTTWNKYTLDKLGSYLNGKAFKKDEWKKEGLPIIRIQNLNQSTANFNFTDKTHESRYKVENGDLLVSWAASLGVYLWDHGDAWLNQHIFKVIPNENLVTKDFLFYLLKSVLGELFLKTHGTGMVHITKGDFDNHEVYIPDIPSQKMIVMKLNTALPLTDTAQGNIKSMKNKLFIFRQAILSAAVSGRLTEDWREANLPDLTNLKMSLNEQRKSKKQKTFEIKEHEISELAITEEDIPTSWYFEKLGNASTVQGGIQKTPKRAPVNNAYPYLRVGNVYRGYLKLDRIEKFEITQKELHKLKLEKNDLLIVEGNGSTDQIGRCAIWNNEIENCVHQNHIIRCRPLLDVESRFLLYYLNSPIGIDTMVRISTSTSGLNTLSVNKINNIIVPLPPHKEQIEIVKRVEAYLEIASTIEEKVGHAEIKISKLSQSILSKVFNHEL